MARQTIGKPQATETRARGKPTGSTPVRSIVKTRLSEQTYEAIKERILDQTLPPAARLNIDSLSRELAVSSSPIREALARLEAEHLVVSEQYAGYAVAAAPSAEYLRDLLEYRLLVEAQCALIGAERRDKNVLLQMRQAFEKMAAVPQLGTRYREYRRFVQADARFHQILVDSAENQVTSAAYGSLHAIIVQSRLYLNRQGGSTSSSEVIAEHQSILDAFLAGDGPAARQAVIHHLEGGRRRLINRQAAEAKPMPAAV